MFSWPLSSIPDLQGKKSFGIYLELWDFRIKDTELEPILPVGLGLFF